MNATETVTDTRIFHLEAHVTDPSDMFFDDPAVASTPTLALTTEFIDNMFTGLDSDVAMRSVTTLCDLADLDAPSEQSHNAVRDALTRLLDAMDVDDDFIEFDAPGVQYVLWREA